MILAAVITSSWGITRASTTPFTVNRGTSTFTSRSSAFLCLGLNPIICARQKIVAKR